ncbi:hypothetical protein CSOJ01_01295 [Colletotrichum sojae]|uniref:Uncharacterized protein n=1 Tax=Colletotrichum sojae TaxID=2175907 RepID=A0A8H6JUD5_9PEZI|nr:hypothetical protein CSOJ01_01295 [Colletotrichum sojae]
MSQDDSHLDPAEDSEYEDVLYGLPAARGPRGRLGSVPITGRPRERLTSAPMAGRLRGPLNSHPPAGRPSSTEEGSGREDAAEGFDNHPPTNRPVSPAAGLPRRENVIREMFGSRPPGDRPPRASPAEGSEGEDSRGRGERLSSKPVTDRFVSPDEGSVPESEDIRGFFSSPSSIGRAVSVYSDSTGQGPRSPEGGTDGGSIIAPRPRRPALPISIMARMNSARDYHVTQPPSVASDNDVARHGIRERGYSIFEPEGLAVQAGSPTFRAYRLAPPRVGPGFDNRPAPQPPGGSHARSWLFVPPHRIADEEARVIVKLYEDMYEYSESTRASTLPTEYRYPPPRDEAARQRKEDFEARTGETMSDADFYALFDLETSTDGMISGLLEWMQGRDWVKVPFVNRIIHQIGRLMYTSAQEETRLRKRWREECERLKQTLEGFEKRQAEERRAAGLDVDRERAKKIERIRELWKRIKELIDSEEKVIREKMGPWPDGHEVNERVMSRITVWEEMYDEFTNLLDERDGLEEVIEAGPEVWTEDLERLSAIDANIERAFLRFVEWEMEWSTSLISWIQGGVEDTNGATLLRDVHKCLSIERRLLKKDLLGMKEGIAEMQRTARMYRAKSKNDDQRESTPGDAAGPPECRAKCRALEQEVADLKRRLRESERKAKSMTRQRDEARSALDRVTDGDVETALGHIDSYRNLFHTEMFDAMGYLSEMLESVGNRVQEQTSLFQSSLDYLGHGGDPRHIAEDLRSLNHSTQIMSESTLLIQGRLAEHLDDMKKHKKTCDGHIEKEDPYDRERREVLISSMRVHIEELEEQQTRPNLAQSVEQLEAQLDAKSDELRARIKLLKQLEKERDQQDGEGNFGRKATEKIQGLQAEIQRVNIEMLGLQVQLEERNESQIWTPWDGVPTTAAGPDPDGRRAQQVAELRRRLLEAVVHTQMTQVERNKRKTSLRGVLRSVFKNRILPNSHRGERRRSGQNETTETTMDDLATFWRLATFQRVRGEIVAALRLGDWATAISQLDDAREWQQDDGTWKPEDYGHEISRSINYLRAYAHMMKGEFLRQSGRESESLGMFTHARGCLTNARNVPRTTPSPEPWVALRSYLEKQAEKSAELVKRQGSKPKTKASQERQKDAQVVGTTSLGSQAERERGRRRRR